MDDQPVFLAPAYRWVCPDCGWLNYAEPTPVEFTAGELGEIRRQLSRAAHETVTLPERTIVVPPELVTCAVCQLEFTATDGTDVEEPDAMSS